MLTQIKISLYLPELRENYIDFNIKELLWKQKEYIKKLANFFDQEKNIFIGALYLIECDAENELNLPLL